MKVFAFSLITNECITEYETDAEANHEEVRALCVIWQREEHEMRQMVGGKQDHAKK